MATERLSLRIDERGSRTVKRRIDRLGRSAQTAGGGVKLLRAALGALGVVSVGLVLRNATRTMASFAQEMSTVRAISGATGQVFDDMRMKARELGATTRFSATQAAEGMTFLARAGFSTQEVMASIGPTLQLAQAGALDLGRAADLASNVLTGFNIEAKNSQRVIDVMALAANSANTNVEQLGQAMSFVAPASASLGVSLEETTAAVQTLSDAGIQATRAGTNLRMVMRKLEAPAGKQKRILADLGLELEEVRVSEVGLTQALVNLREAGASQAQIFDLFGRTATAASVLLTASTGKIQDFTKANENAAGTAAEVARIMDDNLNGALLSVRSAWEELQLAFGDQGAESFLTKTFRGLAQLLRDAAANIENFTKPASDFINFMTDVGRATFEALAPVVTTIVEQFDRWGVNSESLKMTLSDLGLLLVSLLQTAADVADGAISSFNILGKAIATAIFGGIEDAKHFWAQGMHWLTERFKDMLNTLIRAFNNLATEVGIDPIGFLLPSTPPTTEGFEWGKALGEAVADGWITPVRDILDEVIDNVEDSQLKRKVEDLRNSMAGGGGGDGAGFNPEQAGLVGVGMFGGIIPGAGGQGAGDQAAAQVDKVTEAADLMESSVKNSFDTATESLVDFTQTGKLEVRSMVADILSQMARLASQKFFSGLAGGLGLPGFATGGQFTVGGQGGVDSQTVAFRATPGEQVTVTPPGQRAPAMAVPSVATPQMNVKVVNVLDPSLVTEAMASEDGEEVVINVIQRNASTVRQAIS